MFSKYVTIINESEGVILFGDDKDVGGEGAWFCSRGEDTSGNILIYELLSGFFVCQGYVPVFSV